MAGKLREAWRELKSGPPGRRFRERYRRRAQGRRGGLRRILVMAAGLALVAVGLLGLIAPGPGLAGIAVGAALLAQESYTAATALDGAEMRARALLARVRRR